MSFGAHEVRGCLCLHARRAARQLTQYYDGALRSSGLRVTQFQMLAAISEAEPITQQPLANLLGMDRTTLTRTLAVLQRDGLVDVQPGARDRREHHLRLTTAGREALTEALPLWRRAQRRVVQGLKKETGLPAHDLVLPVLDALSAVPGKQER